MLSLSDMGVAVPDILLPHDVDTGVWAAIACDQHTSDREYWRQASEVVGDKPSTLKMMLPEVYLGDSDKEKRIADIRGTMQKYLDSGLFDSRRGFVYVERQCFGRMRRGLVAMIDLERYDWHPGTKALIRATEATIPERIPPRVAIRKGAALDMPHIMLLVNDKDRLLTEGVGQYVKDKGTAPIYDGELMLGGGHITGYMVDGGGEEIVSHALETLAQQGKQNGSTGSPTDAYTFLFAVGDGNHSLATARAVWEEAKAQLPEDKRASSPLRYALVEIVNLYDEGLVFRPIHRVLFDVDIADFISYLADKMGAAALGGNTKEALTELPSVEETMDRVHAGGHFGIIVGGKYTFVKPCQGSTLPVSQVQDLIDGYMSYHPQVSVDYIHGDDEVVRLGSAPRNAGILLPPFAKDGLFQTVEQKGSLPRKSFSMGEAAEKRYYMECRALV